MKSVSRAPPTHSMGASARKNGADDDDDDDDDDGAHDARVFLSFTSSWPSCVLCSGTFAPAEPCASFFRQFSSTCQWVCEKLCSWSNADRKVSCTACAEEGWDASMRNSNTAFPRSVKLAPEHRVLDVYGPAQVTVDGNERHVFARGWLERRFRSGESCDMRSSSRATHAFACPFRAYVFFLFLCLARIYACLD
jgi:hypothetical protein